MDSCDRKSLTILRRRKLHIYSRRLPITIRDIQRSDRIYLTTLHHPGINFCQPSKMRTYHSSASHPSQQHFTLPYMKSASPPNPSTVYQSRQTPRRTIQTCASQRQWVLVLLSRVEILAHRGGFVRAGCRARRVSWGSICRRRIS